MMAFVWFFLGMFFGMALGTGVTVVLYDDELKDYMKNKGDDNNV